MSARVSGQGEGSSGVLFLVSASCSLHEDPVTTEMAASLCLCAPSTWTPCLINFRAQCGA